MTSSPKVGSRRVSARNRLTRGLDRCPSAPRCPSAVVHARDRAGAQRDADGFEARVDLELGEDVAGARAAHRPHRHQEVPRDRGPIATRDEPGKDLALRSVSRANRSSYSFGAGAEARRATRTAPTTCGASHPARCRPRKRRPRKLICSELSRVTTPRAPARTARTASSASRVVRSATHTNRWFVLRQCRDEAQCRAVVRVRVHDDDIGSERPDRGSSPPTRSERSRSSACRPRHRVAARPLPRRSDADAPRESARPSRPTRSSAPHRELRNL